MRFVGILSIAVLTAPRVQAQGSLERGTRVGTVLAESDDERFKRAFQALTYSEQNELLRILTTEMKGWSALEKVPTKQNWELAGDEQKMSLMALLEWASASTYDRSKFEHLRFVSLAHKPFEMKLRFEKQSCLPVKLASSPLELSWKAKWAAWTRWARHPAAAETVAACKETEIAVALSVDPGGGEELQEKNVLRIPVSEFDAKLEGASGVALRRKIWEEIEIVLATLAKETNELPQRLRVIEVAGDYTRNEFLERRRQVILMRNESNQAAARQDFALPAKLTE